MDLVIRREKSCLKLSGWQQGSVRLWGHEGHPTAEPSGLSLGLWGGRPGMAPVLWRCLQWKTVLGVSPAGGVVPPGSYFGDFRAMERAGWGLTQY